MTRFSAAARPTLLLLAVPLVVAGCGSASSSGAGASGGGSATPTPQALSAGAYKALVAGDVRKLSRSLSDVRGAGSRSGLQSRLDKAAESLDKAASDLGAAKPPQAAAAAHNDNVSALKDLSKTLATASSKVESGALCTGPAVVAYLTHSDAASRLRSVGGGLKRQPTPALRLKSGSVLSRKGGSGPGELTISNGDGREGVVKLVGGGKRMSIYIGRKATSTITGIPDGNYEVYFASGVSWDGKRNTFSRNCGFTRFDDKMKFTSGGGQYTTYRITLNKVAGGNASTQSVNPDDFPRG